MNELPYQFSSSNTLKERAIGHQACGDEVNACLHLRPDDEIDCAPRAIHERILSEEGGEAYD